jgi:hypothetical protein
VSEFQILSVRKLANKEGQERVKKFDPETGEPKLVNPATPGEDHEPWPLLGVTIEGEPPQRTTAGMSWANVAQAEGWLKRVNESAVVRPGGTAEQPYSTVHTFIHAEMLVINDEELGPVAYRVTRQPDKYDAGGNPVKEWTERETDVRWFYELELVPTADGVTGTGKAGRNG